MLLRPFLNDATSCASYVVADARQARGRRPTRRPRRRLPRHRDRARSAKCLQIRAGATGLEPATSGVTGRDELNGSAGYDPELPG